MSCSPWERGVFVYLILSRLAAIQPNIHQGPHNSQTANRDSQIRFFVTEDILRIITGCVRVSILKVAKNDISGQAIYLAILSRVEFDLLLKSIRIPSTICRETGRWCRPRNRLSCPSLLPSDVQILQVQQDNVRIQELTGKK